MADDEVTPLGTLTTNYGWTKPTVGADDDVWGGQLNTDLDGIDSTVKSVSNVANAAYPASNPSGYIVDAPNNTNTYARKGAAWTILPPAGVTVSDTAPSSPTAGQLWWDSVGGQLYVWYTDADSSQWAVANNGGGPAASTTPPLANGTAAVGTGTTWARADHVHPTDTSGWLGDNRIINGDMRIDQRNNGASGTGNGVYTVDRWFYQATQASKGTWQRNPSSVPGFPYYLGFTSSSAYASVAADAFDFQQRIEADMISDFAWGTANAQPVTLSFWAYSNQSGTFSGAITGPSSYPFTYTLPANVWTRIVLTIPAVASGSWNLSGNTEAFRLCFDLGSGANFRGPANAWAAANYVGATGSVSIVGINGALFYLTGVKLEIGTVATPYNRQSLAKSLADCQRYYQQLGGVATSVLLQGYASIASASVGCTIGYTTMRAAPTATRIGAWTMTNTAGPSFFPGVNSLGFNANATATGAVSVYATDATGVITLNAEL